MGLPRESLRSALRSESITTPEQLLEWDQEHFARAVADRDEIEIHEVVDAGRLLPAISQLEKDFRDTTHIERYLTPSVALYQELVKSGWDVNTLGEDHENALVPAILASGSASVAFLLQRGATVSPAALELAIYSKTIAVFQMLEAAKKIEYQSAEGGRLLFSAAGAGNTQLIQELLDRGAPVNYRQPQSEDTPLLRRSPCLVSFTMAVVFTIESRSMGCIQL
jgi:ankyrin repeat protein